ncbi:DMT family transporter [Hoeflea sp. TYP-13]|uniref:DMT family transporter n=1 Tax=Hoeflea sp. TYP-13 TaxID=3230023 RepID=UPI0034C5B204
MTSISQSEPADASIVTATVLVVFAGIGFGLVPFFAKSLTDAGMSPFAVSFYRYAIAAVVMLPTLRVAKGEAATVVWGMVTGLVIGIGWVGYAKAIETAPISTVGVLYMTYPVFTLLIGWAWFGENPSKRAFFAASLIILAALVAMSPAALSHEHLPALLLSLGAPIGLGFGINVLTHKLVRLSPLARLGSVSLGSVLGLSPLIALSDAATVLPSSSGGWWLIIGIALVSALVPQLIYSVYAPVIGAARASIAGSIELPTMLIVGWLVFSEQIGMSQWIACALVLAAILLTRARATRNVPLNITMPARNGAQRNGNGPDAGDNK